MRELLQLALRVVVNGIAIAATAALLPGFHLVHNQITTFLVLGIVIGIVNGLIRPVVSLLSCPLTLLTLGLFQFVINALMLLLVSAIDKDLVIDGFWWALLGGFIMGILAGILEWSARQFFPEDERRRRARIYTVRRSELGE
jgi:putative membrane protein